MGAGSRWRILVHDDAGRAYHVASHPGFGGQVADPDHSQTTTLPGTTFDELVVDTWVHLEQMGPRKWWMTIGGVTLWVRTDKHGRPKRVDVYGPGDYAEPVEGVKYGGPALTDDWPPKRRPQRKRKRKGKR